MYSFLKLISTMGLIIIILANLIKNIDYYSYCKLTEYKEHSYHRSEKSKEFRELCKDIFKDFSDHIFLRYTFNLVYEIIKPEEVLKSLSDHEAYLVINRIERTYLDSLKYNLKFFKFMNFIFYVVNLYMIFIVLPEFLTKLIIFILDKCLFLIFLYFVFELKFLYKYKIEFHKYYNYFYWVFAYEANRLYIPKRLGISDLFKESFKSLNNKCYKLIGLLGFFRIKLYLFKMFSDLKNFIFYFINFVYLSKVDY